MTVTTPGPTGQKRQPSDSTHGRRKAGPVCLVNQMARGWKAQAQLSPDPSRDLCFDLGELVASRSRALCFTKPVFK